MSRTWKFACRVGRKLVAVLDRRHQFGLARLKLSQQNEIETCAKCHSRRVAIHGDYRAGRRFLDSYEPSLLRPGLYHDDGQILDEVYVYGSFLQSKMHTKGVRCSDCHDPHSLDLKFPGNQLCTQCHQPGRYDGELHHHHPVGTAGAQCVSCHMPTETYMVVDPRRDHSLRVPRPDLTVSLGTPNACNGCHDKPSETAEWAADWVQTWYGSKRPDDPHWATAIAAGNNGSTEGEPLLIDVLKRQGMPGIVQATAISLLGQYGSEASERQRKSALEHKDPLVRLAAVRVAAASSRGELVELLGPRLKDRTRSVRIAAAFQLAGVDERELPASLRDRYRESLDEYQAAQELNSERAASHINLAALSRRLGDATTAERELRTAIRLEPYLTGPRSELAGVLQQLGGSDAEVKQLRGEELELLKRDSQLLPDSGMIHYRLGLSHYLVGELEAAEVALRRATELAPDEFDFRMAYALLQERMFATTGDLDDFNAAVASLRELERIRPDDRQAKLVLKRMLATRSKLDR